MMTPTRGVGRDVLASALLVNGYYGQFNLTPSKK
jgi:hypothetical protein